jgi:hypothetical protein
MGTIPLVARRGFEFALLGGSRWHEKITRQDKHPGCPRFELVGKYKKKTQAYILMEGSFEILERSSSRLVVRSRFRKTTFSPIPSIIITAIIAGSLIFLFRYLVLPAVAGIFWVLFNPLISSSVPYFLIAMLPMLVATEGSILLYGYGEWQITTTIDRDSAVMIVEWFRLSRNERIVMWTAQRKQYLLTSGVAFSVKFQRYISSHSVVLARSWWQVNVACGADLNALVWLRRLLVNFLRGEDSGESQPANDSPPLYSITRPKIGQLWTILVVLFIVLIIVPFPFSAIIDSVPVLDLMYVYAVFVVLALLFVSFGMFMLRKPIVRELDTTSQAGSEKR